MDLCYHAGKDHDRLKQPEDYPMAVQPKPFFTIEQYLALERNADYKSEYLHGQIFAMAGGSPEHNKIGFNLSGILHARFRGGPCGGYTSDQKVLAGGLVTYPDVTVVCGEPRFMDERRDVLTNPTLIVEVLSDSTEAWDRGEKFVLYETVETLREYVLVSQKRPLIERYLRQGDGTWVLLRAAGLQATIRLESVGCDLKLADVFEGVKFETTGEENGPAQ
jgi:Uma2 family endonuclease